MPRANECIFCSRRPLTREHIWPQWLHPYVLCDLTSYQFDMQFVHETHSERTQKKSGGDPRNRPVRVVCAGCNGGWMSRLQQTAKPLLIPLVTGQAVRLDAQAQQVIAVWCAMSVMTAEFLSHDRQAISLDERRSIKATQSV